MSDPVVIIGAGMAGLACARRLADAGIAPIVLDKGTRVGGRVSTRRVAVGNTHAQFDHGAQYATVREPGFQSLLDRYPDACAGWTDSGDTGRIVGVPGMSSLPAAMARGVDVRQGIEVTTLQRSRGGWTIEAGSQRFNASRVVLTVPAPQVESVIGDAHPLVAHLRDVAFAPCLTLMAAYAAGAPRPFITRQSEDEPLAWIAQDSSKPGRPRDLTAWVAQAQATWSALYLNDDEPAIARRMEPLLRSAIGACADDLCYAAVHRWRYARVTRPLGQPFLCSDDATLHVGGDWCLGARVRSAWASGDAIAQDILEQRDRGLPPIVGPASHTKDVST